MAEGTETISAQCACSEIQEENEDCSPDCWDARSKIVSYSLISGDDHSKQGNEDQHKTSSGDPKNTQVNVFNEIEDQHKMSSSDSTDIQVNVLDDDEDKFRMLIAGLRGVGKSALTNSIIGSEVQVSKSSPGSVTQKASEINFKRMEKSLTCFDTPGLSTSEDNEIVQKEYKTCLLRAAPGLHAILIVQKATSYSDDNEKFLNMITKMFGEGCWDFVVYVFTHIDEIDQNETLEDKIQKGDKRLRHWLQKCGNRYVGINNMAKGKENRRQIKNLLTAVEELVKKNGNKIYTNEDFKKTYDALKKAARDLNESIQSIRNNPQKLVGGVLGFFKLINNL